MTEPISRHWDVLLIGGASGTGKTSVSYRLARHFGIGITEVDDFQQMLKVMTTPEQQPLIHYWDTHPEAAALPPDKIVDLLIGISRVLQPGLTAVIANHLEASQPFVLEGDFILPDLAVQAAYGAFPANDRVRAIFIDESDERQIVRNYLSREPQGGEQTRRAHVSWLYNRWLTQEAERLGIPSIPSRPWETLFDRVLAVFGGTR